MMKLNNQTKNLLIIVMGILVAVATWMLVASPMKEKTETIKSENASLKEKKDEYESIHAQIAKYQQGILDLTDERETLLSAFPAGISKEDEILYWANVERANAQSLAISDLTMSSWQEVFAEGYDAPTDEEGATQLHLYKAPVNYVYASTYDGLKGMVKYVFAQNDKKSIEGLVVSYDDSTGNLTGTIDINMYYMVGTGKEYEPYTIPTVPTGIANVFRATNEKVVTDVDGVSEFDASGDVIEVTED